MSKSETMPAKGRTLTVRMLDGLCDYVPVWEAMKAFTENRAPDDRDEIWLLQHLPVFTQGQAGKAEHVLSPGDIPVVQVDRGGQVTYHGPGQLVVYLMIDIDRLGIGTRQLVSTIETSIIRTLKAYGIDSVAKQDAPGVYVDDKKIASIGLRIRKGKSFHGLSLNVDMNLEPFSRINPCGYQDLEMIQLVDFPNAEPLEQVAGRIVRAVQESFGYDEILMEYTESL
jgi:lipoyl(octanoyl) transferase